MGFKSQDIFEGAQNILKHILGSIVGMPHQSKHYSVCYV